MIQIMGSLFVALCFAAPGRLPEGALKIPLSSPAQGALQYELVEAFPNLNFSDAVAVVYPPDGSARLFVLEQGGTIRVFHTDVAQPASVEFLNITPLVRSGGELGLLGLAFDPHYAANGYFYVNYTAADPLRTVIARFKVSDTQPDRADPASRTVLLEFNQPYSNHNGGNLAIGPDGALYIATGDGGSGGDPQRNGQNMDSLLGKILRLDIRSPSPRAEFWAYGLRNPWRFSFDRQNGNLWIGDVGQNAFEEVDVIPAGTRGLNLGWNICEGLHLYPNGGQPCTTGLLPIHEYDHSVGSSVIGGYVYRGTVFPLLQGRYLFGDFYAREVWALTYNERFQKTGHARIATLPSGFNLSSFGEDPRGEILFVGMRGANSRLFKLQQRTPPTLKNFPRKLSQTGLFSNTAQLQTHPDLLPYEVNVPLWSDSAKKKRWMALPPTGDLDFHPERPWGFPLGTVFVKHFEIELGTHALKRLETRVLMKHQEGWAGYTYRWNSEGTDADLLEDRDETVLSITDPDHPTQAFDYTWKFPGRAQCMQCHTEASGFVLGFNTHQLNRDDQIETLKTLALLPKSSPAAADLPHYPELDARSYLAVNCSMCHQPGGPTPLNMDLRFTTPLGQTQLLEVATTRLGLHLNQRVQPGSKESSVLWERMRRLDHQRMPLIGSSLVDTRGLGLVGEWIDGLLQ